MAAHGAVFIVVVWIVEVEAEPTNVGVEPFFGKADFIAVTVEFERAAEFLLGAVVWDEVNVEIEPCTIGSRKVGQVNVTLDVDFDATDDGRYVLGLAIGTFDGFLCRPYEMCAIAYEHTLGYRTDDSPSELFRQILAGADTFEHERLTG